MLQACIDDSGNFGQGEMCVLAGYVASTEAWADFADRWDAALKESPAIEFFKVSDAFARVKQFDGWTEAARDKKVDRLIDVIQATKITYGVAAVLDSADYLAYAKDAGTWPFNDAFYILFTSVMQSCLLHQREYKIREPVDFIFDISNRPRKEIDAVFDSMVISAPGSVLELDLIKNPPIFRDEKEFLPIQAADLLAGQIRNRYKALSANVDAEPSQAFARLVDGKVPMRLRDHPAQGLQYQAKVTREASAYIHAGTTAKERYERFLRFKAAVESLTEEALDKKARERKVED